MADQLVQTSSRPPLEASIHAGEQPGRNQPGSENWFKSGIDVAAALHGSDINSADIPYHFQDNLAQLGPLSDQERAALEVLDASEQRARFIALIELNRWA